jgi:hypothetical protein
MTICKQPVSLFVQVKAIGLDVVRRHFLVTIRSVEHLVGVDHVDPVPASGLNDVLTPYFVGMPL